MSGFGGNAPLPADALVGAEQPHGHGPRWYAAGRDAYLAIAQTVNTPVWLLPGFLCPIVPETLRQAGCRCVAYRPGQLAAVPADQRRPAACVLMWDVDRGPDPADRQAAAESFAVVEDRCLWAGLPADLPATRHWRIGSPRKWLGIAGGWASGPGLLPTPADAPVADHALAMASGGLLRALREHGEDPTLESATLIAVQRAEQALGIPRRPRNRSRLCAALLESVADPRAVVEARWRCGLRLAAALGLAPPAAGAIGLRVRHAERDALVRRLAMAGIYAPVHWRDGDWSGDAEAARLAATTLTIPAPALDDAGCGEYARRLGEVLPAGLSGAL